MAKVTLSAAARNPEWTRRGPRLSWRKLFRRRIVGAGRVARPLAWWRAAKAVGRLLARGAKWPGPRTDRSFTFYEALDQVDGSHGKSSLEEQRREHLEMWTLLAIPHCECHLLVQRFNWNRLPRRCRAAINRPRHFAG